MVFKCKCEFFNLGNFFYNELEFGEKNINIKKLLIIINKKN